jgi:hypothetical protein
MKKGFNVFYISKAGVYKHPNERPKRTTDQSLLKRKAAKPLKKLHTARK